MGQWAKAPLVFVLAQVRFLPQTGVTPEGIRDAITNRIGSRFRTINQTNNLGILLNLDGEANIAQTVTNFAGYDMLNDDVNGMVRIFNGALTYATTAYANSSLFQAEWMDILQSLPEVGVTSINRLGLRYVDFVIPSEGHAPEDYVVKPWDYRGMTPLPGSSGLPEMNVSMMDIPYPEGRMRVQFMRGIGTPNLPADLQGMLPPATNNETSEVGLCGIIDTDRWMDGSHPPDVAALGVKIRLMHTDLSNAFRAMITPLAKREWDTKAKNGVKA
jgi:uncharacterized protein (TIGR04255 family)